MEVKGEHFTFQVGERIQQLGPASIRQIWIPKTQLYDPANRRVGNSRNITDCYWALCQQAYENGEKEHPDDAKIYLLARLLPLTLTKLAAKVMPDRSLGKAATAERITRSAISQLEDMLRQTPDQKMALLEFRDKTFDMLGMPTMDEGAQQLYEHISQEILADAAGLMAGDPKSAVRLAYDRWAQETKLVYSRRRWKSPAAELAMRVLSYECRTALDECYSDVWAALLRGPLCSSFQIEPATLAFLRLWHVIQKASAVERADARFDLFHGHVLGLHPASGLLIRTSGGQEVLGRLVQAIPRPVPEAADLLREIRNLPEFGRFLHAMFVALFAYTSAREEHAQERKSLPLQSKIQALNEIAKPHQRRK
jgi:hypothetical protein